MHFSSTLSEGDEVGFEEVRHFPLPAVAHESDVDWVDIVGFL
jgi:hypothetical protein